MKVEVGTTVGAVRGGQLLNAAGHFAANEYLSLAGDGVELELAGHWLTPGFVDAHTHLSWSAFAAEQRPTDPALVAADTAWNQWATLRAGVTVARDAGGLSPAVQQLLAGRPGPRTSLSIDIITAQSGRGQRQLRDRVAELADAGATWIKIAATGGVGAGERALEPSFARGELTAIVCAATKRGLPTMVHAWGGPALEEAVAAGATSIEHAVHLTAAQARRIAASGIFVVPTMWIYLEVARLAAAGELPPALLPPAQQAVEAHPAALRNCLEAGVKLALGTDAGLPHQHGRNLHEVATLISAGAPPGLALAAATSGGVELLRHQADWTPSADLVVFDADPSRRSVLLEPERIRLVIQGGSVVHCR